MRLSARPQVTFLHLFHHSSITFVVGSIVRFDYSGDMFLPILLNSIVHVLMHHLLQGASTTGLGRKPALTSNALHATCWVSAGPAE